MRRPCFLGGHKWYYLDEMEVEELSALRTYHRYCVYCKVKEYHVEGTVNEWVRLQCQCGEDPEAAYRFCPLHGETRLDVEYPLMGEMRHRTPYANEPGPTPYRTHPALLIGAGTIGVTIGLATLLIELGVIG